MGFVKASSWRIISFEFMGLLLLLLALSLAPLPRLHAKSDTKKGDCWYVLEVKTSGGHWDPGTHNPVRVRFMDIKGSDVTIHPLKDPFDVDPGDKKSKSFKRRATARFNISDQPCLEEVCSLQFQVQGDDDWRVDYAQVHGKSVSHFKCDYHKKVPANAWSGYDRCHLHEQLASTPQDVMACHNDNENENKDKAGNKRKSKKIKKGKFLG